MKKLGLMIMCCLLTSGVMAEDKVTGLVIPVDNDSMYVRDSQEKQTEVKWTPKTRVAVQLNYRKVENVKNNTISYTIHSSSQKINIPLPDKQAFAPRTFRHDRSYDEAVKENFMSDRGLKVGFGETPKPGKGKNLYPENLLLPKGAANRQAWMWMGLNTKCL